jgi:hypothetical protein
MSQDVSLYLPHSQGFGKYKAADGKLKVENPQSTIFSPGRDSPQDSKAAMEEQCKSQGLVTLVA